MGQGGREARGSAPAAAAPQPQRAEQRRGAGFPRLRLGTASPGRAGQGRASPGASASSRASDNDPAFGAEQIPGLFARSGPELTQMPPASSRLSLGFIRAISVPGCYAHNNFVIMEETADLINLPHFSVHESSETFIIFLSLLEIILQI